MNQRGSKYSGGTTRPLFPLTFVLTLLSVPLWSSLIGDGNYLGVRGSPFVSRVTTYPNIDWKSRTKRTTVTVQSELRRTTPSMPSTVSKELSTPDLVTNAPDFYTPTVVSYNYVPQFPGSYYYPYPSGYFQYEEEPPRFGHQRSMAQPVRKRRRRLKKVKDGAQHSSSNITTTAAAATTTTVGASALGAAVVTGNGSRWDSGVASTMVAVNVANGNHTFTASPALHTISSASNFHTGFADTSDDNTNAAESSRSVVVVPYESSGTGGGSKSDIAVPYERMDAAESSQSGRTISNDPTDATGSSQSTFNVPYDPTDTVASSKSVPAVPSEQTGAGQSVISIPYEPTGAGQSVISIPYEPTGAGRSIISNPYEPMNRASSSQSVFTAPSEPTNAATGSQSSSSIPYNPMGGSDQSAIPIPYEPIDTAASSLPVLAVPYDPSDTAGTYHSLASTPYQSTDTARISQQIPIVPNGTPPIPGTSFQPAAYYPHNTEASSGYNPTYAVPYLNVVADSRSGLAAPTYDPLIDSTDGVTPKRKTRPRRLTRRRKVKNQYFQPHGLPNTETEPGSLVNSFLPIDGFSGSESFDGNRKYWPSLEPINIPPTEPLEEEKRNPNFWTSNNGSPATDAAAAGPNPTFPRRRRLRGKKRNRVNSSDANKSTVNANAKGTAAAVGQEPDAVEQDYDLHLSESFNPFLNATVPISNDLHTSIHHSLDLLHPLFNSDTVLKDVSKIPENKTIGIRHKLSDHVVGVKVAPDLHADFEGKQHHHLLNHDSVIGSDYERQVYKSRPRIQVTHSVSVSTSSSMSTSSSSSSSSGKRPDDSDGSGNDNGSSKGETTTPMPSVSISEPRPASISPTFTRSPSTPTTARPTRTSTFAPVASVTTPPSRHAGRETTLRPQTTINFPIVSSTTTEPSTVTTYKPSLSSVMLMMSSKGAGSTTPHPASTYAQTPATPQNVSASGAAEEEDEGEYDAKEIIDKEPAVTPASTATTSTPTVIPERMTTKVPFTLRPKASTLQPGPTRTYTILSNRKNLPVTQRMSSTTTTTSTKPPQRVTPSTLQTTRRKPSWLTTPTYETTTLSTTTPKPITSTTTTTTTTTAPTTTFTTTTPPRTTATSTTTPSTTTTTTTPRTTTTSATTTTPSTTTTSTTRRTTTRRRTTSTTAKPELINTFLDTIDEDTGKNTWTPAVTTESSETRATSTRKPPAKPTERIQINKEPPLILMPPFTTDKDIAPITLTTPDPDVLPHATLPIINETLLLQQLFGLVNEEFGLTTPAPTTVTTTKATTTTATTTTTPKTTRKQTTKRPTTTTTRAPPTTQADLFNLLNLFGGNNNNGIRTTPRPTTAANNDIFNLFNLFQPTTPKPAAPAGNNDIFNLFNLFQPQQQPVTTTTPAPGLGGLFNLFNIFTPAPTVRATTRPPTIRTTTPPANDILSLLNILNPTSAGGNQQGNSGNKSPQSELEALVQQALLESLGVGGGGGIGQPTNLNQQLLPTNGPASANANGLSDADLKSIYALIDQQGSPATVPTPRPTTSKTTTLMPIFRNMLNLFGITDPTSPKTTPPTTAIPKAVTTTAVKKTPPTAAATNNTISPIPVYNPQSTSQKPKGPGADDLILQILEAEAKQKSTEKSGEVTPTSGSSTTKATTTSGTSPTTRVPTTAASNLDLLSQLFNLGQAIQPEKTSPVRSNQNDELQQQLLLLQKQQEQQQQQLLQQQLLQQQEKQLLLQQQQQEKLLQQQQQEKILQQQKQQQQQQNFLLQQQQQQQPAFDIQSLLAQSLLNSATTVRPEVAPSESNIFHILANQFTPKPKKPNGLYYWVDLNAFMGDQASSPNSGIRPKLGHKDYFIKVKREASRENTDPTSPTEAVYLIYS